MPQRDKEMSAFTILAILVILVLVSAIIYFIWKSSRDKQSQVPPPGPAATASATGPVTRENLVLGGLPLSRDPVTILKNRGYISGYSETRRDPLFVCYMVFSPPPFAAGKRPSRFNVDMRSESRISHDDYTGSGFDRGHMAPNHAIAICFGPEAQDETFFMTNICPQRAVLNQKVWENLERQEVDDYAKRFTTIRVIDGPIFDDNPKTIGLRKIHVPAAFYKILIENKSGSIHTFQVIMPQDVSANDTGNLPKFTTTIRDIESKTGLNFFPDLPQEEQDKIETVKSPPW